MTFQDLSIDADMVQALADRGIVEPFPIQQQTIPLGLSGQDIIGQAKGILIERFGVGPEQAFTMLVDSSQKTNIKLVEVATWLVDEARKKDRRRDAGGR